MRIALWILAIWILSNVLFVLIMMPPLKRRPDLINRDRNSADRNEGGLLQEDADPTFPQVMLATAMGIYFMLAPVFVGLLDAVTGFQKRRER